MPLIDARQHPAEGDVALTAVVIARDDERRVERALRSVVAQKCTEQFEVIVVVSGTDGTAQIVQERFPQVSLVELDGVALPGRARNAGLRLARGRFITFPGSHVELSPGSIAVRVAAHDAGWSMVTGSVQNGTRTFAGWASYFLDHATSLPGRPGGPLPGAPIHSSYATSALLELGGFREDVRSGEDTAVNLELVARGNRAFRCRELLFTHHSPCTTARKLVAHHFTRGRGGARRLLASGRRSAWSPPRRGVRALLSRGLLNAHDVIRWGAGMRRAYLVSLPLVWSGMVAYFCGMHYELARHGQAWPGGARGRAKPRGIAAAPASSRR